MLEGVDDVFCLCGKGDVRFGQGGREKSSKGVEYVATVVGAHFPQDERSMKHRRCETHVGWILSMNLKIECVNLTTN